MMRRRFATGDSSGPKVNNLQRTFWHLAINGFQDLLEKWQRYAVEEEGDESEYEDYTEDDFVVDAAAVLILAGTSVTQLMGQNVDPHRGRVLPPRQAYEQLVGHPPSDDFADFIRVYDALRHFGPPKYEAVEAITPHSLCQHLRAAQSVWRDVLERRNEPIGDHLRKDFAFPE
jgi:hypothetical protein